MIKQALLAMAFAVGLTSFAAAQEAPAPLAAPAPMDAAVPPLSPGDDVAPMPGDMPPPPPGKGPRPGDHRGPPPPMKGVEIRMGKDTGIRINCGEEPMAACLAAAKTLTDKIPNLVVPPAPALTGELPAPAVN